MPPAADTSGMHITILIQAAARSEVAGSSHYSDLFSQKTPLGSRLATLLPVWFQLANSFNHCNSLCRITITNGFLASFACLL